MDVIRFRQVSLEILSGHIRLYHLKDFFERRVLFLNAKISIDTDFVPHVLIVSIHEAVHGFHDKEILRLIDR